MKNSNIKIKSDDLKSCATKIESIGKNIEEIFNRVDEIMTSVYDSDVWKGETNEAYYNRYLELKKYFPKVNKGIVSYAKFLNVTSENYINEESKINSDINSNIDSLNVNG